jgi:hypothetical protein
MKQPLRIKKSNIIMATVFLRSKTGRSLIKEDKAIHGDITPYIAAPETYEKAISEFKKLGFTIEAQGITLSISGPLKLFEKTFKVKIYLEKLDDQWPNQNRSSAGNRTIYLSSKPLMEIKELEDVVEGVSLAKPGVLF